MPGHPPQGHRPQLSGEPVTSQGALGGGGGPGLPPPENCPYYPRPSSLLPFPASALHRTPPLPRAPTFLSPFCYPYLGKSSLFHPPSDSVRFAAGYKT